MRNLRNTIAFLVAAIAFCLPSTILADTPDDIEFRRTVRTLLRKHCVSCHNEADKKAGINLDAFDFVVHVVRRGELFQKVVNEVRERSMPPPNKSRMSNAERDTLVAGILKILDKALLKPDPGPVVMRRLSHREYRYTIKDLMGLDFDAQAYFPTDASGGEGFDNQSGVLYMTPLLMERYYSAADSVIRRAGDSPEIWRTLVPRSYRPSVLRRMINWWSQVMGADQIYWSRPKRTAKDLIIPFANRAYRRFLNVAEEEELLSLFEDVYFKEYPARHAFKTAVQTVLKKILVSPAFLYRMEANIPSEEPYAVNNFELATRLSYFLWSSVPDEKLFQTAYLENLQDSVILRRETLRMMSDPKFKRFAESFAPQWLGVQEITMPSKVDLNKFPEFTKSLSEAMVQEVIEYFDYIFHRGDLLQLIESDFAMLNEELAAHYELPEVKGKSLRPVALHTGDRGGILGMGAVLTATSLPLRTSPVLRGQWVVEQILGDRIPPPPPDVPELEEAKENADNETDLRKLLEMHRFPSTCRTCHQKMDPIGFGLENYDAIGRWRTHYQENVSIDVSGTLEDGTSFQGPSELKAILSIQKEKFANTFSRKMLSYALGRGIQFLDSHTVDRLTKTLIECNFNGPELVVAIVTSYPFRYRRSDLAERYKDNVL